MLLFCAFLGCLLGSPGLGAFCIALHVLLED